MMFMVKIQRPTKRDQKKSHDQDSIGASEVGLDIINTEKLTITLLK